MLIHVQGICLLREVIRPDYLPGFVLCITPVADDDFLGLLLYSALVEFRDVDAYTGFAKFL